MCSSDLLKAERPLRAICDENLVGRVLVNLLRNALRFTPQGREIAVAVVREGNALRCSVSDPGPGIPAEHHEKIFCKFSQLEDGNRRLGAGLGLTFCKLAIEGHGGKIGVESKVGQGSTFWFTIPLSSGSEARH